MNSIPIKCVTCGEVLADKYLYYVKNVRELKMENNINPQKVIYLTENNCNKTPEGIILDKLKLNKQFYSC